MHCFFNCVHRVCIMHKAKNYIELTIKGLYMSFFTKCSVFTPAAMVEIPSNFLSHKQLHLCMNVFQISNHKRQITKNSQTSFKFRLTVEINVKGGSYIRGEFKWPSNSVYLASCWHYMHGDKIAIVNKCISSAIISKL